MRLNQLEIFGFKSFAQKIVIPFEPGITAIVGPNGCGKSNVVEAIRWVLGEQRAGSFRSQRMEDVIFAGTRHRKALGMAEVALAIENPRQCAARRIRRGRANPASVPLRRKRLPAQQNSPAASWTSPTCSWTPASAKALMQ